MYSIYALVLRILATSMPLFIVFLQQREVAGRLSDKISPYVHSHLVSSRRDHTGILLRQKRLQLFFSPILLVMKQKESTIIDDKEALES